MTQAKNKANPVAVALITSIASIIVALIAILPQLGVTLFKNTEPVTPGERTEISLKDVNEMIDNRIKSLPRPTASNFKLITGNFDFKTPVVSEGYPSTHWVSFPKRMSQPSGTNIHVAVSLNGFDMITNNTLNGDHKIFIDPRNITQDGFNLRTETYGDQVRLHRVKGSYIAWVQ